MPLSVHPGLPRRRPLRHAAVAGGLALLLAGVTGCSEAERPTTAAEVERAADRLQAEESATVTAGLDGSGEEVLAFLRATADDGDEPSSVEAALLSRAELTVAVGSRSEDTTPLREREDLSDLLLAASLNFGDRDVVAYKSVGKTVYARLKLAEVAEQLREAGASRTTVRTVTDVDGQAEDLPRSLKAAKAALTGDWVAMDPEDFDQFARTADALTGLGGPQDGSGRGPQEDAARAALAALDHRAQRTLIEDLRGALLTDGTFHEAGTRGGVEHVRAGLPARRMAEELAPVLRALGMDLDTGRTPEGEVTADLEIRRGMLVGMRMDLAELYPGKVPPLPLELDFGSGDALSVQKPAKAKRLQPQDLVAAGLYLSMRAEDGPLRELRSRFL